MTALAMKHSRMAASTAMGRAQAVFPIWATFSKRYSDRAALAAADANKTAVAPICATTWKSVGKKPFRESPRTSPLRFRRAQMPVMVPARNQALADRDDRHVTVMARCGATKGFALS